MNCGWVIRLNGYYNQMVSEYCVGEMRVKRRIGMIEVKLIRTGMNSKKSIRVVNRHGRGEFTKKFKDVEELVAYFYVNHMAVSFARDFKLPPDIERVFRRKFRAMLSKRYPAMDKKIQKAINRRKKYWGM